MNGILVFGEAQAGRLQPGALEAMRAARDLAQTLDAAVDAALLGVDVQQAVADFSVSGMRRLLVTDDDALAPGHDEAWICAAAAHIAELSPQLVILPASERHHEWTVQLAARLGAGLVANCTALTCTEGELLATRPVCGGAVQAQYGWHTPLKLVTLASGVWPQIQTRTGAPAAVEQRPLPAIDAPLDILETRSDAAGDGPDLRTARIVLAGGLGLGSAEHWKIVEDSARLLNAAVGASRAAVEAGWVAPSRQVGFSGLKVAPDLYIAAGISGAVHHLAGIARANTVVAINSDDQAPIFSVAHYGVVGDAKAVLPALAARLQELRRQAT